MRPLPAAVLLQTLFIPWAAQGQVSLSDELRHDIHLVPVHSIGEPDGPGVILSETPGVRLSPWGDYYLVDPPGERIQVFGPNGSFRKMQDKVGQGPDEIDAVAEMLFRNDSIYILDRGVSRMKVFTPDLTYARSEGLSGVPFGPAVFVNDSLIVVNGHLATRDQIGDILHVVDLNGDRVRSVLSLGSRFRGDRTIETMRALASADSASIWAARINEYRIDRVAVGGGVLASLAHSPDFFPDRNAGVRRPDSPPPPRTIALLQDDEGLLWILFAVADDDWEDAVDTSRGPHGGTIMNYNDYLDTVVEVVDPARGRVVARHRVDPAGLALLEGPRLVWLSYENPFFPVLEVHHLNLMEEGR